MPQLIPSDQTAQQVAALRRLLDNKSLTLSEACDCGGQTRHNNGGNYHRIVQFRLDAGTVFSRETTTSEYSEWSTWEETSFGLAVEEIARCAADGWRVS